MVRAGVVEHPSQWEFCGYNEIQNPRKRKGIIDFDRADIPFPHPPEQIRPNPSVRSRDTPQAPPSQSAWLAMA